MRLSTGWIVTCVMLLLPGAVGGCSRDVGACTEDVRVWAASAQTCAGQFVGGSLPKRYATSTFEQVGYKLSSLRRDLQRLNQPRLSEHVYEMQGTIARLRSAAQRENSAAVHEFARVLATQQDAFERAAREAQGK